MAEKITIVWKVSDGYVNNGTHEVQIDKDEWDELTDAEKDQYINDIALENISISWKEKA